MDINVKSLDPEVVARLAEQAEAEGMSSQEWIRKVLQRRAAILSPAELLAQSSQRKPATDSEYRAVRERHSARRSQALRRLTDAS